jgi:hypothetical protein
VQTEQSAKILVAQPEFVFSRGGGDYQRIGGGKGITTAMPQEKLQHFAAGVETHIVRNFGPLVSSIAEREEQHLGAGLAGDLVVLTNDEVGLRRIERRITARRSRRKRGESDW